MAALTILLSGGWRVSSVNPILDLITRSISAQFTCSTYNQFEIVLLPNVSDYVLSNALFSAPTVALMTATNLLRLNFAGLASNASNASAGVITFKDFWGAMGASAALPSAFRFSNSGSDSATLTVLLGQ